jgi:hypothetical protein
MVSDRVAVKFQIYINIITKKYSVKHSMYLHNFYFVLIVSTHTRLKEKEIAICVLRAQSDTLSIERFSRNRQCTFGPNQCR